MDNKNMIEELYKLFQEQVKKEDGQLPIESALEMMTSAIKENELNKELKDHSDSLKTHLESILPENLKGMEPLKDKAAAFLKGDALNTDTLQQLMNGILNNDVFKQQLSQLTTGKELDAKSLMNGFSSMLQGNGGAGNIIPMNLLNLVQGMDLMKLIDGAARRKNKSKNNQVQSNDSKEDSKNENNKSKNNSYKVDYEYDECDLWY
ncbi:hypothetical protein KJK41_06250 [Bacillus haikouensis]|nr:hypothetical protein KJK41_06250 [Bacillus haikouensis]